MAIRDVRELRFDMSELARCLETAEARALFPLPAEKPLRIELLPADNCVELEFADAADGQAGVVKCDGAKLAVLMMKWCQEQRIPLPRQARKFLRVTKDGVVLRIEN